jgi:SPP1 family predicted phage head-tail adaptor
MSAGTFTRWIRFEVFTGPDDGQGGQDDAWQPLVTVWGAVLPVSATQLLMAGLLQMEVTHRITTHWRRDLLTERRALRAQVTDGPLFSVKTVRDVDGRRIGLECDVVEVQVP